MASSLKLCWIWPGPSKQNVKGDILTMKHRLSAYLPFIGLEPVGGYTTEVSIMHGQYTSYITSYKISASNDQCRITLLDDGA